MGNWVEDLVGRDLVEMNRTSSNTYISNSALSHTNPKDMTVNPHVKSMKKEFEKTESMPYSLLFSHGLSQMPSEERFKSTFTNQMKGDTYEKMARPHKELERTKAKNTQKEVSTAYFHSTETRQLSCHQLPGDGVLQKAIGFSEELPRFPKHKTIL